MQTFIVGKRYSCPKSLVVFQAKTGDEVTLHPNTILLFVSADFPLQSQSTFLTFETENQRDTYEIFHEDAAALSPVE